MGSSEYLVVDGLGLGIPAGATIRGISATVARESEGTLVEDLAVRLVRAGVIQSTDRADPGRWLSVLVYATYGGATDLWGGTWTPADINHPDFGLAFAVQRTSGPGDIAYVDHVRVIVQYDVACP
jgi:hypothetical protein